MGALEADIHRYAWPTVSQPQPHGSVSFAAERRTGSREALMRSSQSAGERPSASRTRGSAPRASSTSAYLEAEGGQREGE